ncbi:hypothetical protein V9K67_21905 [Paraflavisolibacter sp. H34]|uniref:hypothetical protein n=1 Tax=Huijunlia imazamoxiresistens TaxID=3127457 RepID=UPI003019EB5C
MGNRTKRAGPALDRQAGTQKKERPILLNAYAIPGLPREPEVYSADCITQLAARCERYFHLPPDTLQNCAPGMEHKKGEAYGETAARTYGDVCLSEIRKAIIVLVSAKTFLTDGALGRLLGLHHHTSVLSSRRHGTAHLEQKDPKFLFYYRIIKELAGRIG